MTKKSRIKVDEELMKKSEMFMKKINSEMHFKSELIRMTFDWVNEIDFACPYIDNIIRNPKLTLVSEEDIVKIEKAKKITVASVKDLSMHTEFIEQVDKETNDVKPSKILIERNEETFNIYENRFVYTLLDNLTRFMVKKEALLESLETQSDKVLEYIASTDNGEEKINIELKISSNEIPNGKTAKDLKKEIATIKLKIKRIKDYMASWQNSEFVNEMVNARAPLVVSPIKKTNIILKNPNFQIAMNLWNFLRLYDIEQEDSAKKGMESKGDDILKGILDDSFLMNYFVLDSISSRKREQKRKISKYAVIMITQQIQRIISLLLNKGIKISEEEILDMISVEIKKEKSKADSTTVKNKFKDAMEEYIERTQDYL